MEYALSNFLIHSRNSVSLYPKNRKYRNVRFSFCICYDYILSQISNNETCKLGFIRTYKTSAGETNDLYVVLELLLSFCHALSLGLLALTVTCLLYCLLCRRTSTIIC